MVAPARKPDRSKPRMPTPPPAPAARRLSFPVLVGTIVALAILLPGLYFWRARQVQQGADVYVRRAEELAQTGQLAESADYLFLYLKMRPDDADAKIQLAETYDRVASQRGQLTRAIELYYQALAKAPADRQRALKLRLAELLLQTEAYEAAQKQVEDFLAVDRKDAKVGPKDAEAQRVQALALYGQAQVIGSKSASSAAAERDQPEVGEALEVAYRLNPTDVQLALTLADVYRRESRLLGSEAAELPEAKRHALADQCLDRLIAADPKQASAHLARYQYRLTNGLPEASADLDQAVELDPKNPVVLLAAANHALSQARDRKAAATAEARQVFLDQAGKFCEQAIEEQPALEQAYLVLGEVQAQQGHADQAEKTWELGLQKAGKNSVSLNARLAQLLLSQGEPGRAEPFIQTLKQTADTLRKKGYAEAQLGFAQGADVLAAQMLLAKRQTQPAIELLQKIGSGQKTGPFSYQAAMLLGSTYASQGDQLRAARTFESAAANRPEAAEPYLAAAAAWTALDRPDQAQAQLEKAVAQEGSATNYMLLVGTQLRGQLKLPAAERTWKSFEASLAAAKEVQKQTGSAPDAWKLSLLEAEYLLAQNAGQADGKPALDAALKVLRAAEKEASAEGLTNLVRVFARLGADADADRGVAQLQETFPKHPSTYLTAAAILAGRKDFAGALARVEQGIKAVTAEERLPLQLATANLHVQQGNDDEAWKALGELHQKLPQNQTVLQLYLEFALEHGKFEEAQALTQTLRKLGGAAALDGQFFDARRLLLQSTGQEDPRLAEAEKLIAEIRRRKPEWPAGQLLWAELQERRGEVAQAVAAYQQAIGLGEQRLVVYERLIPLLYQLQRFDEAAQYMARLSDRSATSTNLSTVDISLAMREGQLDRALEMARRGVAQRPQDPLAQVWFGQLLLATNQPKEAEAAMQRAVDLGPSDPRAHGALVNFFVRTKQLERARKTIEQFGQQAEFPPVERELILASGYTAIGDRPEALKHLRAAEKQNPQSAPVLERLGALFAATGESAAAEKALRRALELDPKSISVRRLLAGLLADNGGEKRWQEALELLAAANSLPDAPGGNSNTATAASKNPQGGAPTAEKPSANQGLQALLLVRRGGADNLAKAEQMLEKLLANPQTAGRKERRLLAQVRETRGNVAGAAQDYLSLVKEAAPSPEDLAAYVDFLLRQSKPGDKELDEQASGEIERYLEALEKNDSDNLAALSLRVRLLIARQQIDQIEPLLEPIAKRLLTSKSPQTPLGTEQKLAISSNLGDLYFSARQFAAAERWYRRAYKLDPQRYNRLARSIAEQGRAGEAIGLCVDAAARDTSTGPALALASVLLHAHPDAADAAKADELLSGALAAHSDKSELLTAIAALRITQQRLEEACSLYRHLLELEPQNVTALNDLATALAENPTTLDEALSAVDRALELAGPQPNLLDTKGTILLAQDKLKEAIALLEQAAATPRSDPRFHFHLAVAQYRSGNIGKAREALAIARAGELTRQVLTESDTRLLAELDEKLP